MHGSQGQLTGRVGYAEVGYKGLYCIQITSPSRCVQRGDNFCFCGMCNCSEESFERGLAGGTGL